MSHGTDPFFYSWIFFVNMILINLLLAMVTHGTTLVLGHFTMSNDSRTLTYSMPAAYPPPSPPPYNSEPKLQLSVGYFAMSRITRKEKFSLLVKMHNTHTTMQAHHDDDGSSAPSLAKVHTLRGHGAKTRSIHDLRSEAKRLKV